MEDFQPHWDRRPTAPSNVDTDQIIPAVYLKRVTKTGSRTACSPRGDPIRTSCSTSRISQSNDLDPRPDFGTGSSGSTPSGPYRTMDSGW